MYTGKLKNSPVSEINERARRKYSELRIYVLLWKEYSNKSGIKLLAASNTLRQQTTSQMMLLTFCKIGNQQGVKGMRRKQLSNSEIKFASLTCGSYVFKLLMKKAPDL